MFIISGEGRSLPNQVLYKGEQEYYEKFIPLVTVHEKCHRKFDTRKDIVMKLNPHVDSVARSIG